MTLKPSHPDRHAPRRLLPLLPVLLAATLLTGCGHHENWKLLNLKGIMPQLQFNLHDDTGKAVTAKNYLGKIVMLYFGYTHCPDVCPATMARMSQALSSLGPKAKQVQVLFVSVDPKRDTPKVLQTYTHAFAPEILGLTGTQEQLRTLTKRYRVTYGYGKPDADGNYEVTHSSAIFIFDRKGNTRLMAQSTDNAAALAHDLRQLIAGA
jgi:protein SCO1/2